MIVKSYTRKPYKMSLGTRWEQFVAGVKHVIRIAIVIAVLAGTHYAIFLIGGNFNAKIVEVQVEQGIPPVMQRIFNAESRNSHYCTEKLIEVKMCGKNELGQVLVGINVQKDGTKSTDVGIAQINIDIWGAQATKLGYDLYKETDNKEFAMWIYANYGTDPWYSSSHNW